MCLIFPSVGVFLVDSSYLVLMTNWNNILDPKIDMGRGTSGCSGDRSLVNRIVEFDVVDRYRVDVGSKGDDYTGSQLLGYNVSECIMFDWLAY